MSGLPIFGLVCCLCLLRTTELQEELKFENFRGWKEKTGKFQGMVIILMEFQGVKGKNNGKFRGGCESFDGIPEGVQFLKLDILNRGCTDYFWKKPI